MRILSIDAWRYDDNWTWNNWFNIGDCNVPLAELDTNRKILKFMRDEGYLSEMSKGKVTVDDDQFNLVIINRRTLEPLFAIEYGPTL